MGLRPGVTAVHTDAVLETPGRGKNGPGQDADMLLESRAIQLNGVHLLGQLNPKHVAACGPADPRACGKVFCNGLPDGLHLSGECRPQALEVAIVSA